MSSLARRVPSSPRSTAWLRWLLVLSVFFTTSAFADTYIIPIWANALPSSDGAWWARAIGINASSAPVSYQVTGVYPLQSVPCPDCTGESTPATIEPGAAIPLNPRGHLPGRRMTAGAFAIETSAPLAIQLVAYRAGRPELRQYLQVARRWIGPGHHTISAVERAGTNWRMNLFVINPNQTPVTISVWAGERLENERRQVIAPHSTAVIAVAPPLCNGVPCPGTTEFPPSPITVHIEADGEVLTSMSSLTAEWAVFSLADAARE